MEDFAKLIATGFWLVALIVFACFMNIPAQQIWAAVGLVLILISGGILIAFMCCYLIISLYEKYSKTFKQIKLNKQGLEEYKRWRKYNNEKLD